MKTINTQDIVEKLSALIMYAQSNIEECTATLIKKALSRETSPYAKDALEIILSNNECAKNLGAPACQDTGIAVIFADIGSNVYIDGNLTEAINSAVRQAYSPLRKSLADPISRKNTGDNTPAVIHYNYTDGDNLTLTYLAKGAGSENMSRIYMLTPSDGRAGILNSVLDCVKRAGANPCPPIILGVGIGGTMEKAAELSKRALTRPTGTPHTDSVIASLESDILDSVNKLTIGAQGFGGVTTALAAAIETFPTHIGMLPVAVNIQCHSVRHGKIVL